MLDPTEMEECKRCGVVVTDSYTHEHWHEAIREVVENFSTSIDSLEEAIKMLLKKL